MLNQFMSISLKLQGFSAKALQKDFRPGLAKVGRLLRIWGSATVVSFLAIMVIYAQFFGRFKLVSNKAIYENHYHVNQAGTVELFTWEGYGLTSYGENGLVVNKTLPPDVFRVLFIGDSYVKAKHVSDHEKFTEIVEHKWNATHPEVPIQTVNLGQSGLNIATYLSFGDNMDDYFQPDLVFILLNQGDFKSLAELERETQRLADPLATPRTSCRFTSIHGVFTCLEEVTLINQMGYRGSVNRLKRQATGFLRKSNHIDETKEDGEKPWRDTEAIAAQLEGLREIWGERLVIIYNLSIPHLGKDAPATYEDAILREIGKQGIPVINLYQPLLKAFQERKPPKGFNNSILGEGHFNQYGHQLVAEEIVKFMETADDLF